MLLISCAAVPESIVKLRTGQDVAGVAVGFVGQDIASFGLLNLDILYIFLDDVNRAIFRSCDAQPGWNNTRKHYRSRHPTWRFGISRNTENP